MCYNVNMKVAFYTLGCKVNQYETEAMREKFARAGFSVLSEDEGDRLGGSEEHGRVAEAAESESARDDADVAGLKEYDDADVAGSEEHADVKAAGAEELVGEAHGEQAADVYIINTCTVTHLADRKSRQFIRRARRQNPNALIAVTGCYAQVDPDAVALIEGVDLIVGTNEKQSIVEYVEEELARRASADGAAMYVRAYDDLHDYCSDGIITAMESRTRAYVKIQEGCNRFCSYCIIPFARGRVRSREEAEILEEVRGLVDAGFREIVLTGINTALYGADVDATDTGAANTDDGIVATAGDVIRSAAGAGTGADVDAGERREFGLSRLLRKIDEIPGEFRIRLSSLEPTVVSFDDVESILDSALLCNHLHLSIQSGADNVLRAMNRRYTRAEYLEIVGLLRGDRFKKCGPDFGITTDIIVGFPGETEEDFQETLELVRSAGFSKVHAFRYSPRRGTKAATLGNQVSPAVKAERVTLLMEEAEKAAGRFMDSLVGTTARVLVEEIVDRSDLMSDAAGAGCEAERGAGCEAERGAGHEADWGASEAERGAGSEAERGAGREAGLSASANRFLVGYSDNYVRVYIPVDAESAGAGVEYINEFVNVQLTRRFLDGVIGEI